MREAREVHERDRRRGQLAFGQQPRRLENALGLADAVLIDCARHVAGREPAGEVTRQARELRPRTEDTLDEVVLPERDVRLALGDEGFLVGAEGGVRRALRPAPEHPQRAERDGLLARGDHDVEQSLEERLVGLRQVRVRVGLRDAERGEQPGQEVATVAHRLAEGGVRAVGGRSGCRVQLVVEGERDLARPVRRDQRVQRDAGGLEPGQQPDPMDIVQLEHAGLGLLDRSSSDELLDPFDVEPQPSRHLLGRDPHRRIVAQPWLRAHPACCDVVVSGRRSR